MIKLFDYCNFPQTWAELNPRLSALDQDPTVDLRIYSDLAQAQVNTLDQDCLPEAVGHFMVKIQVAMSYTNVLAARVGCMLNNYGQGADQMRAKKAMALNGNDDVSKRPKSEAALERALTVDPDMIGLRWSVEDLKVARQFCDDTFRTLQKGAECWRARYYGAGVDRKLTSGLNDSDASQSVSGLPPRIG